MCSVSSFADWAGNRDFAGPVLRQYMRLWSREASFNSYVASRGIDPSSVLFRCAVHASLDVDIAITLSGRSWEPVALVSSVSRPAYRWTHKRTQDTQQTQIHSDRSVQAQTTHFHAQTRN